MSVYREYCHRSDDEEDAFLEIAQDFGDIVAQTAAGEECHKLPPPPPGFQVGSIYIYLMEPLRNNLEIEMSPSFSLTPPVFHNFF